MELIAEREEVWAASVQDKPGALASVLSTLADAGADLDFTIVRRAPDRPGTGVVFVTPLRADREVQAATSCGFSVTQRLHSVRVEAPNEPGIVAKLCRVIADAGINLRGLSAAVLGTKAIIHFGVDSAEDERTVIKLMSEL
jgi:hypothetical protein